MTIYNPDGGIILDAPVTTEAVEKFTLMGDWYVLLPFMSLSALDIPEGSYITYKGKKWEIMAPVYPESSGYGYKYSLQFEDQQNKLKKSICFWLGGPNSEAVFSDTTDLTSFGNLIVANMNRELGSEVWEFGGLENVDNQETVKVVSFSGDTCWDAVNNIANTFDCEWWTEQNGGKVYLFFGKLERGSGEIFKEGEVVSQMPARSSNNTDGYGTRFYVFGSSRNLTSDYGQADQGGTTNHVSEIRLRLPNNLQYIDARPDLTPSEVTPVVVFFDDVYPKNTDTVTSVEEKTITPEEGEPYPAYVVYAGATPFVPSDVIEDDSFQIQFTSGDLTGLTFKVAINYDPATWKPEDGFDKKFEIVAQIETSGDSVSIIPNADMKPKSGDTFVLTGVKLPEKRIAEAEQELLEVGTEYAQKHSGDTNVYDCPTNPVYCAANEKNYDAGQVVILQDPRFGPDGRRSRIQGYEKKLYNEFVATYTVGDNRTYSRTGKIENDVKQNIYSQRIGTTSSGAAIYLITRYDQTPATDYNAYSAMRALWQFANKQTDERFKGNVTFDKDVAVGGAVISKDFRQGDISGSGFGMYHDANGNAVAEVDILKARKEAVFNTAVINQVTFQVGATVFSNGGCEIARIEELDDVYRCYYDTKDDRRFCGLVVDDQVRCQRYDATQNRIVKYYWRLVVAVGDDYVDLSKTDVDGTGVPESGDEIAQFGHRTDKTRQGATIIDPKDGSSVVVYSEINSYSLVKKNFVGLGTNPQTGRPYLYCYGDFFLGDRELKNQFLTFQIPEGQTIPQLFAQMNVMLGAGSSGLTNLTEWPEKQQQIDNAEQAAADAQDTANTAQQTAEDADRKAQEAKDYINSTLPEELAEINRKLDGVVESWYYPYTPTLENEPAASWIRDGEQAKHEGDTFTNTQAYVDAGTTPDAGKSWRWVKDGSAWKWTPIADSDAVKALQQAAQAQDAADSKRRVFVVQPTTPYDVGDMWSQGSTGDLMRCIKSRASGAFDASDWDKASKYTDDTVALEAKQAAQTAQQTADTARDEAQKVKEQQAIYASDSYISPMEKTSLKQQQADIQAEYAEIIAQAGQYGVSTTSYASAYTAANAALTKYTAASPENIPVESDYPNIQAYYPARQTVLDAIAAAAKKYVDDVDVGVANLVDNSNADWAEAAGASGGYKDGKMRYIDGAAIRGREIVFRVELKGEDAQATSLGYEIFIAFADGTKRWIGRYGSSHVPERGTFEKTYVSHDTIEDKEISEARIYPVFYTLGGSTSGKLYIRHEFVAVGNKLPSTWAPSVNDQKQAAIDGVHVGGVNLLDNSATLSAPTWNTYNYTRVEEEIDGYTCLVNRTGSGGVFIPSTINQEFIKLGKEYISAVWVYGTSTKCYIKFGLEGQAGYGNRYLTESELNKWVRFVGVVQTNVRDDGAISCYFGVEGGSSSGTDFMAVRNIQMEEGTTATSWKESPADTQAAIDEAQQAANEAKSRLDTWASDGYISPTEKTALKQQQADIQAEYAEIIAQAGQYSVSTTTYASAYTAANNALTKYTASTPENIPVEADYANIASYYTARKTILDAISQAAQEYVNSKVSDLDYLKEVFPNAMLDVNGVVLAQLLGVKSSTAEDAAVVAGFYGGSDETLNAAGFKDPTHGILMMFAGADNVQSAASAKTRVYGDGSLFTQMLYADGGKIGGFTIQGSSLQAGASDADNLYLSSSLLKFSPGDYTGSVYIGSNVMPGVSGMKGLMRMELEGDVGTLMYTKATKVGGLSIDRMRSWTNYGDLFSVGSKVFVSDKFRGTAYSDTIELNFDQTDTFIFSYSANSGTTMAVNLPAISAIESTFGSRYVTFKLTLLCERSFRGTIRITAPFSAPLLNNSGDIINGGNGYIDMGRGDVIVLQYASGYYYFVSRMS